METTHKTELLNKGFIELIDLMPSKQGSCEAAVVEAARVSYLSGSKGAEKDERLLKYMLKNKHTSPFEQVVFKFRMHAPLLTHWQLVRHRTFSFNYSSGRYVEFDEDEFYVPQEWRLQSQNGNKQMSNGALDDNDSVLLTEVMQDIVATGYKAYKKALALGVAREQARLFLPGFSVYYTCVFTVDAHNLMNFLRLRLAKEAQYEIRVYARAMYEIFKFHMPLTSAYLEETEVTPWLVNPEARNQFAVNDLAISLISKETDATVNEEKHTG